LNLPAALAVGADVPDLDLVGRQGSLNAGGPWLSVARPTFKDARLEIFDKLGHDPMQEDLEASAAPLATFVEPIPKRSGQPSATGPAVHSSAPPRSIKR
jgi:hypothetical protein